MRLLYTIVLLLTLSTTAQAQLTCHWRQISGPAITIIQQPDSANTLVTGLTVEGFYDFEFSVTNEFGTGRDTVRITVLRDVLTIDTIPTFSIRPPEIKKLEVKMITKGAELLFQIKSPRQQKLQIMLYNTLGQPLARSIIPVKHGVNYVALPAPRVQGIYIIQFYTYFEQLSKKLIL